MDLADKLKALKEHNKVTLFFPSTNPGISPPISPPLPNLGIGYIGTFLRKHGCEVCCVDGNVLCPEVSTDENELEEYVLQQSLRAIAETAPDILGVGTWTTNFPFAAEVVSAFARLHPECLIILGGYQATFLTEFVFSLLPQVDIVVIGEGEHTMLELLHALEQGTSLEKVNGIAFSTGRQLIKTAPRELVRNLDDLPFIDYDLFVGFKPAEERGLMLLTSRGCPYDCTFCSCKAFWRNIRTRSIENIAAEIRSLRDRYQVQSFGICDDLFSVNAQRIHEFCEMLSKEGIRIDWSFNSRIDTIDESLIRLLRRNGVSRIFFGLESVNLETLRYIGEKNPARYAETARRLLRYCVNHKVPGKWSTIVGFPNETLEEMTYMLEFVAARRAQGLHMYTGLPICFPGTRLWHKYETKEISLVKIKDASLRRNSSGLYAAKYEHLPECVPNAWMIENVHVPSETIEDMLRQYR